jgi:hypothetical protein
VTADQVGRAATNAVLGSSTAKSFNNAGMGSQAQVVVAAKIQVFSPVDANQRALRGAQRLALAIESLRTALL